MEEELQALLSTLRQGQTAKASLPAMNTQMAEAKALRGQPLAPIDQETGFMSPLQAIAGMIGEGKSSQKIRQLTPEIAAAQQQMGDAEFGEKQYGLQQTLAKEQTRVAEREADAAAKLAATEEAASIDEGTRQADETVQIEKERLDREQKVLDREQRLKIALLNNKNKKTGSGLKPTGSAVKDVLEAKRLKGVSTGLYAQFNEMTEDEQGELSQPIAETLTSWLPDGVQRLVEEQMYSSDKVKTYKTKVARFESKLSQLASGLSVTGYEMSDRKKWSPNAEGITQEERQRRLDNVQEDLESQIGIYQQAFPDYPLNLGNDQPPVYLDKSEEQGAPQEGVVPQISDSDLLQKYGGTPNG